MRAAHSVNGHREFHARVARLHVAAVHHHGGGPPWVGARARPSHRGEGVCGGGKLLRLGRDPGGASAVLLLELEIRAIIIRGSVFEALGAIIICRWLVLITNRPS